MNNEAFLQSLKIMGWGMLGIFVVVAIFYFTIWALNKFLPANKE
jgi:flagellar biogenesis protein FliO